MGERIALFGGIYSNYLALEVAIEDARQRDVSGIYCLGDMGAFGPFPDRVFPLLNDHEVQCVQGNYDDSIGNELDDCQCGYTDPRDNHFAQISYDYTMANTSSENRRFLRELPSEKTIQFGGKRVLLCHGSPRRTNEFLWESTCSTHFLDRLCKSREADLIACTHSGIKWRRDLPLDRALVNVGVLGRPENDGKTNVWYALLEAGGDGRIQSSFVPVQYDYRRLAREMESERLPSEFIQTIMSGWWTTCLEVLPGKERKRGKF